MIEVTLNLVNGEFGFAAKDSFGHIVHTDTSADNGGTNSGVRPMQLLLMGLGSCSGIDIVSILKKQKQKIDNFKMHVKGQREKDKVPALWENIHMLFELYGDIDEEKAKRACTLSVDKYCSVAETLRRAGATITWEVKVFPLSS